MRRVLGKGKRVIKNFILQKQQKVERAKALENRLSVGKGYPKVRIAVAGAGKFAQVHLGVLSEIPNVEIVGVSNRGNSDISGFNTAFNVERTFNDYNIMLDETEPDGVFVLVSHFETVNVAKNCLERGISSFIEKPAGYTSKETASLAKVANQNNCLNMVGLNRRFISVIQIALTRILQHGPLKGIIIDAPEGIRMHRASGRLDPKLYDLWLVANTIHAVDLFRCLGGEVEEICSFKRCREEENGDSFSSIVRLSDGCLGSFNSHWNSAGGWCLSMYGEGIKTETSLSNYNTIVYQGKNKYSIPIDPIDKQFKAGLYVQDQSFINALALDEELSYPASDLDDSVKTMKLIENIIA